MAASSVLSLLAIVLLTCSTVFISIEAATANNNGNVYGFSIDLIHRDSPKSPFYKPSETHPQRVRNAFRRSLDHVHRFDLNPTTPSSTNTPTYSDIISANGDYLLKVSIGTPPFEVLAIVDTSSDLTWTQCKPCTSCFEQRTPMFDPTLSSSYRKLYCKTAICSQTAGGGSCGEDDNYCHYSVQYGDNMSYSNGISSIDTLTLSSTSVGPVSIPSTAFGCGFDNNGTFSGEESGIIGLGRGAASLITQMGSSIEWKFSYCLVPSYDSPVSSKMNFGSNGVVSGPGVVSTRLVSKPNNTFYFLNLEAISVGNERIEFYKSLDNSTNGNIIIDLGTTLTLLPLDFYDRLKVAVIKQVKVPRFDQPGKYLDLCYVSNSSIETPGMTAHFAGGADVKLNSVNTFIRVSDSVVCFAFAPAGSLAVYGNLAQMNFLVGYDVDQGTVSFKPTDCTKS